MGKIHVNEPYELYQIITDFEKPLEIFREAIQNSFDENAKEIYIHVYEKPTMSGSKLFFDIWDNGAGLKQCNIENFFDVANSTKVSEGYVSCGKHGYKGHGSKVYFNAEKVIICSKTAEGDYWAAHLDDAVAQIETRQDIVYSDIVDPSIENIELPEDWESGFFVRIIGHRHFKTQFTRFQLNHDSLRDYCQWFSVIGTVRTLYDEGLRAKDTKLYLRGLLAEEFKRRYVGTNAMDPEPVFVETPNGLFEEIKLGHYFPPQRSTDTKMKAYARSVGDNKASYYYYSKMIYNETIIAGSLSFRLIISFEGRETKRRYDPLLTKQGRPNTPSTHTDGTRYGLWACKGGIPVEKIDDWIEGGRGVGTYTYMQAFVDCDDFSLTANRGSIRNTDIEKLNLIKTEVNRVFKSSRISDAMEDRQAWEDMEKTITSIETDRRDLMARYRKSQNRKYIHLPDGLNIPEPTKTRTGYSESETMIVLLALLNRYPDLFKFKILDYNTNKGIDFVIDYLGSPKYIELKGSLTKKINHPFRYIYKFICYDIEVQNNEIVQDLEEFKTSLCVFNNDKFESNDENYNKKTYTSFVLSPEGTAQIESMEIIQLKSFVVEVLGATIS